MDFYITEKIPPQRKRPARIAKISRGRGNDPIKFVLYERAADAAACSNQISPSSVRDLLFPTSDHRFLMLGAITSNDECLSLERASSRFQGHQERPSRRIRAQSQTPLK